MGLNECYFAFWDGHKPLSTRKECYGLTMNGPTSPRVEDLVLSCSVGVGIVLLPYKTPFFGKKK